jgi:hypothetical protein
MLSPLRGLSALGVKSGNLWKSYWSSMTSATVEDADPTKVVMTFTKENTTLVASDFTISGFTVSSLSRDATNKILTLTLSTAVVYGNSLTIVCGKSSGMTKAVTNNVLYKMVLTSTGTGAGVATLQIQVSSNCTLTLDGNGYFYSDSGGTADQSQSWDVVASTDTTLRTRYIKVTSGNSNLKFPNPLLVTKLGGTGATRGWLSQANAPSNNADISKFTNNTILNVNGNNTWYGDISNNTSLTFCVFLNGSSAVSGNLTNLTNLTSLYFSSANCTLGGDIGLNNMVNGVLDLELFSCHMNTYTPGATWSNATVLINPSIGYGYSSTMIDNILIDMAASNSMSGKTITLQGSNAARTSASDAAVAKLTTTNSGYTHTACTVLTN